MRHWRIVSIVVGVCLLGVFVGLLGWHQMRANTSPGKMTHAQLKELPTDFGLTVSYRSSLKATITNKNSRTAESGTLWELRQPAGDAVPLLITADYEQGDSVRRLGEVTHRTTRDAMLDNLERQLPQLYPQFKLVAKRQLTVHGSDAVDLTFTYMSQGQALEQRLLLLIKSDEAAAYIRAQTTVADFAKANQNYFADIFFLCAFSIASFPGPLVRTFLGMLALRGL